MKSLKTLSVELVVPFVFCWFFMSVLVDVVAIPTVFRNISNITEAGKIGMTVFHRFNCFELFFAVMILIGTLMPLKKSKLMITLAVGLFFLSLLYTFYMTPMITKATLAIHQTALTDPNYAVLQTEHAHYHTMYRYFDTAKLFILMFFGALGLRFNISRLHKECV